MDSTGIADITVLRTDLQKAGFAPGDVIYCCAFASPEYLMYTTTAAWFDPRFDQNVYSGFSPYHSEVKSFILP